MQQMPTPEKRPTPDRTPPQATTITPDEAPAIDAQNPDSMPRAEDDERVRARSPEFHDQPGSGGNR